MERKEVRARQRPGEDGRAPFQGRVLVVRGGALGDFILTLPALRALREAGFEVELLTRPAYGRFAMEAGIVSGWRSLDAPESAALNLPDAPVDPALRAWLSGFDRVVSWLPDADGAFRQQVRRCGVRHFHQGDWRCAGSGPAAEQLAAAVAFAGSGIAPVVDFLGGVPRAFPIGKKLIALHPGSGSPRKNWPLERWLTVMRSLQSRDPDLAWLVVTGEAEAERFAEIGEALNRSGLPWHSAHGLDLTALAGRLRDCRMLLGHDSGISHLAAACGVPCGLLFGPTDPAVWAPAGKSVRVLRAPLGDWAALAPRAVVEWLMDGLFLKGS